MDDSTRQLLLEVNRRFYDQYATSFGQTRFRPWPAWADLLACHPLCGPNSSEEIRILDAGCGNGRFGLLAADKLHQPLVYQGWDQSLGLLQQAEEKLAERKVDCSFHAVDLSHPDFESWPSTHETFHIIGIFGVLHHLPGEQERRRLLTALGRLLAPGGELWASWWMLHHTERFEKKQQPWQRLPEVYDGLQVPTTSELESGDSLLSWQKDGLGLRYLHFPAEDELERLKSLPGLSFIGSLKSDGPTGQENLYLKWRLDPTSPGF